MTISRIVAASFAIFASGLLGQAGATTISGPSTSDFSGFNYPELALVGYAFSAQTTTFISSFEAVTNGGNTPISAQTYRLYDASGTLLNSIDVATSSFVQSRPNSNDWIDQVNVNWTITAGDSYFLLGTNNTTQADGDGFTSYHDSSPVGLSDGDITITYGGYGFNPATQSFAGAFGWLDIQSITTGASAVPEPAPLALLAIGLLGIAAARRRLA